MLKPLRGFTYTNETSFQDCVDMYRMNNIFLTTNDIAPEIIWSLISHGFHDFEKTSEF